MKGHLDDAHRVVVLCASSKIKRCFRAISSIDVNSVILLDSLVSGLFKLVIFDDLCVTFNF